MPYRQPQHFRRLLYSAVAVPLLLDACGATAQELGAAGYLRKPVSVEGLLDLIERQLVDGSPPLAPA